MGEERREATLVKSLEAADKQKDKQTAYDADYGRQHEDEAEKEVSTKPGRSVVLNGIHHDFHMVQGGASKEAKRRKGPPLLQKYTTEAAEIKKHEKDVERALQKDHGMQ